MIENVAIGPNTFNALMLPLEAFNYITGNADKYVIQLKKMNGDIMMQ